MRSFKHSLAEKLYTDEPIPLKIVRPRKRKKGWLRLVFVGIGSLSFLTLIVVIYLALCSQIVKKQYALDHVESLLPSLREENSNLKIQVRELSKPSRIDSIARRDLKMEEPAERILIVQDDEHPREYAWKGTYQRIGLP